MDIGIKIRQLREAKNIKQQEIAEFLGIAQSAYNLLENGKRKISTDELLKIAEMLQVSIIDFFKQDGGIVYSIQHDNQNPVNNQNFHSDKFDNERLIYEKLLQEKTAIIADKNVEITYLRELLNGFMKK
jgi:transcriptional regulator with XRE-family HTH domain